jgi:hypothetical protein
MPLCIKTSPLLPAFLGVLAAQLRCGSNAIGTIVLEGGFLLVLRMVRILIGNVVGREVDHRAIVRTVDFETILEEGHRLLNIAPKPLKGVDDQKHVTRLTTGQKTTTDLNLDISVRRHVDSNSLLTCVLIITSINLR